MERVRRLKFIVPVVPELNCLAALVAASTTGSALNLVYDTLMSATMGSCLRNDICCLVMLTIHQCLVVLNVILIRTQKIRLIVSTR